ncbi:MAG: MerR family transcriptional regulator, partial [Bacillota bacterium]
MKISKFANKYNLSNDTVRYYMDLNLITPKKRGGHYNFDQECESQIKEVIKLKKMNFSLKEIKNIFNFKRIGKLTAYQKNNYYQSLYKNKIKVLENEINELQKSNKRIEDTLAELKSKKEITINTFGVDLSVLSLFSCPKCGEQFKLSAEDVKNNQVLEGSLNCDCGNILDIRDGIIYNIDYENEKEALTEEHIENYIKDTDQKFLDKSFEGLDWLQSEIKKEDLESKIILEPGSGFGYLLRQIYNDLNDDSIYICVDYDHSKNIFLKRMLEMTAKKAKVIF